MEFNEESGPPEGAEVSRDAGEPGLTTNQCIPSDSTTEADLLRATCLIHSAGGPRAPTDRATVCEKPEDPQEEKPADLVASCRIYPESVEENVPNLLSDTVHIYSSQDERGRSSASSSSEAYVSVDPFSPRTCKGMPDASGAFVPTSNASGAFVPTSNASGAFVPTSNACYEESRHVVNLREAVLAVLESQLAEHPDFPQRLTKKSLDVAFSLDEVRDDTTALRFGVVSLSGTEYLYLVTRKALRHLVAKVFVKEASGLRSENVAAAGGLFKFFKTLMTFGTDRLANEALCEFFPQAPLLTESGAQVTPFTTSMDKKRSLLFWGVSMIFPVYFDPVDIYDSSYKDVKQYLQGQMQEAGMADVVASEGAPLLPPPPPSFRRPAEGRTKMD